MNPVTTIPATERETRAAELLRRAMGLGPDAAPFPWQLRLLREFAESRVPRALDIPTGLGKTAVMAIWLVARAAGTALPRRLVYIVDRRAVVDQATEEALKLRNWVEESPEAKKLLGLGSRSLLISTLRGRFIDNREWLEDPTVPAIVVGTVDMVGSRLLFEGYGTSRKMRPYHAALLACDSLIVLDEAHLVPPFEELLDTISTDDAFWPLREEDRALVPRSTLLSLSATGRTRGGTAIQLDSDDFDNPVVARRLQASKRLRIMALHDEGLAEALARKAWALSSEGALPVRCIIFAHKRTDVEAAASHLRELAGSGEPPIVELLVGSRRTLERERAAEKLKALGFFAGEGEKVTLDRPAFLLATSAGEVGVDLDADHMVSDLVAWERMVQRLGRVNRRGSGDAEVVVVVVAEPPPKKVAAILAKDPAARNKRESKALEQYEASVRHIRAQREVLEELPRASDERHDGSPRAIRDLNFRSAGDDRLLRIVEAATSPDPLRPALTRPLLEGWAMTSLRDHPGRPRIAPWLRGWQEDEPRTTVLWRTYLPAESECEVFFEAAPPHLSEQLETETAVVVDWLLKRANAVLGSRGGRRDADSPPELDDDDVAAVVLDSAGELRRPFTLRWFKTLGKRDQTELFQHCANATLIVHARIAGLTEDGLLDASVSEIPRTVDDGSAWIDADDDADKAAPVVPFRVRVIAAGEDHASPGDTPWRERYRSPWKQDDDEVSEWLVVQKWRHDASTEDDRSSGRPQLLEEHQGWCVAFARLIGERLGLPSDYVEMVALAASIHDEGKRSPRWQRAFRAPLTEGPYAKTQHAPNISLLDGYRHELGSLIHAESDERIRAMAPAFRDLALHLVAAHHGFTRPLIATNACDAAPPSELAERARAAALRFVELQGRWGPWGLAWWETLLRSADQQASRKLDEEGARQLRRGA